MGDSHIMEESNIMGDMEDTEGDMEDTGDMEDIQATLTRIILITPTVTPIGVGVGRGSAWAGVGAVGGAAAAGAGVAGAGTAGSAADLRMLVLAQAFTEVASLAASMVAGVAADTANS
jgi:hypothetical protein